MSKQPEQVPARPVGVTKLEIRQLSISLNSNAQNSTTQSPDILALNPQLPGMHSSTPQYPNISTSTALHPDITSSTLGIRSSTPQHTEISTSTPQLSDIPITDVLHPDIPTSNPHYSTLLKSTSFYPNPSNPTSAAQIPNNMDVSIPKDPNMNRVSPQTLTGKVGGHTIHDVFRPMDQQGTMANQDVFFPDRPGTSVDNLSPYKDLVESAKKTIEKISLDSKERTEEIKEYSQTIISKKRLRSSSQPNHLPLPCPVHPITGLPVLMTGGHVTPLPQMSFPFPGPGIGPSNVPFHGFVGPFHPLTPPPFSDLGMQFNGPLSAPSFGQPSHLLFQQYGSPFPNPHGRRAQR